jgi:biopolymer transport protein ExbD
LATWDVFRSDRLEVERALTTEAVRAALARGDLRDDDLIRPAGTTVPWARLADLPALVEPAAEEPIPEPPATEGEADDSGPPEDVEGEYLDALIDEDEEGPAPADVGDLDLDFDAESRIALPVVVEEEWDEPEPELVDEFDPLDEDEEAAEFTLSRGGPEKVEELDLAAMVDVAFQLVLFFLVTATTVLYKSLEVPRPSPEAPAAGAQQGRQRTLDDLKNDFILVEIDAAGVMKIDREPVAATMPALVERLRQAREKTGRKEMLLSAEYATAHRNAVLAYDAANEIGLKIAIARPAGGPPLAAAAGGKVPAAK